jgi:hypothetical protein
MLVHIIADKSAKSSQLRSMLEPLHAVTCTALGAADTVNKECSVAIVAADLRNVDNIAALKDISRKLKATDLRHPTAGTARRGPGLRAGRDACPC